LPQIEVDPLSLDLRGAGPGRPVTRTLTIRNLGAELTLQVQLSLTPSAAGPNFTVEDSQGDVLSRVVGVQAQRSVELTITHSPVADLSDATLLLETNDPINPMLEVPLRGL